jgi:hypothetical protein
MTPDGISKADWDRVRELAVDLLDAGDEDSESRARLLEYLDQLEVKYGLLPSILATRADFVEDPRDAVPLLHAAYELAESRADRVNALYIAHSLAFAYINQHRDPINGGRWLGVLADALTRAGGESDIRDYEELEQALGQLQREV